MKRMSFAVTILFVLCLSAGMCLAEQESDRTYIVEDLAAGESLLYNSTGADLSESSSSQENIVSSSSCADSQYGWVKLISVLPEPGKVMDRGANITFSGKVRYRLVNASSGTLYIALLPYPSGAQGTCFTIINKLSVAKTTGTTLSFSGTINVDRKCPQNEPPNIDSIEVMAFMFPQGFSCTSIGTASAPYPIADHSYLDTTDSGFYYPLGTSTFDSKCGTWLGRAVNNDGCYFLGFYHIGVDMMTTVGKLVYPIADGRIVKKSLNGWGTGNIGLFVEHTLTDSTKIRALYGHVRMINATQDTVVAGQPFATVGSYPYGTHLHFGIIPESQIPLPPYGKMPNSSWPSTNDFVAPIDFINDNSPQ